jgi:hypothetical protein
MRHGFSFASGLTLLALTIRATRALHPQPSITPGDVERDRIAGPSFRRAVVRCERHTRS